MKFAVSIAMVVLLLGMPLGCVLAACQTVDPCCPRTNPSVNCPYDYLDAAKAATFVAIAIVPSSVAIEPQTLSLTQDFPPVVESHRGDLNILNRILRI